MTLSEYLNHLEEKIKVSCTVNTEEVTFRNDCEVLLEMVKLMNDGLEYIRDSRKLDCLKKGCTCLSDVAYLRLTESSELIPKGGE